MNVTYILECSDGTLYTGWTNDIQKRLDAHNSSQGAKYTRSRTPVKLVYLEEFETKQEAMRREFAIKKLTRRDKLKLIQTYQSKQIRLDGGHSEKNRDIKNRRPSF